MPRGDQKILEDPFRTWVLTVDEYNRVRIPLEIRTVVPWLDARTGHIECVSTPGSAGGIQVVPLADHKAQAIPLIEALAETQPKTLESNRSWVDAARLLATAWLIQVNVEASRVSITLPESPRRAQQVPQSGGAAVVFGFGNILEIWDALKWHDHVRVIAKRKVAAISDAIEDLTQR